MIEEGRFADAAREMEELGIQKLDKGERVEAETLFSMLPREIAEASVDLCFNLMLLKRLLGDLDSFTRLNNRIIQMREIYREGTPERKKLENRIFCAMLCQPLSGGSNLLLNLAVLSSENPDASFTPARLSITGKFPSVLRGAKDLSGITKYYRAITSMVRPMLGAFLEEYGAGVCETAIAELLYEKNDMSGAAVHAGAALEATNPEIAFAALALLARIGAVDATSKQPARILRHLEEMLEKKSAYWLKPNYEALRARFYILNGELDKVKDWADGCGMNDLESLTLQDSYILITKAKAYIATGEHINAATLLARLSLFMEKEGRPLDMAECLVHEAIVCEQMGSPDAALQKLGQAMLLMQEYDYIRVFADCGKPLFNLISRYGKETPLPDGLHENYAAKITGAAKAYAALYPSLYKTDNGAGDKTADNGFTKSELDVLRLLETGKTNKVIAQELHIEVTTARFHVSNIMKKLGVSNRTEAAHRAKDMNIL